MLACLLFSGYFAQHAMLGKHGLDARARLQIRAARVSLDIKTLQAELRLLQRDVALLFQKAPLLPGHVAGAFAADRAAPVVVEVM